MIKLLYLIALKVLEASATNFWDRNCNQNNGCTPSGTFNTADIANIPDTFTFEMDGTTTPFFKFGRVRMDLGRCMVNNYFISPSNVLVSPAPTTCEDTIGWVDEVNLKCSFYNGYTSVHKCTWHHPEYNCCGYGSDYGTGSSLKTAESKPLQAYTTGLSSTWSFDSSTYDIKF